MSKLTPAELRQYLHSIPEASGEEEATAKFVAETLRSFGCVVHEGLGGHGVLATLGDSPYRLLRAELDAVAAKDGIGHRCGHDGHMAMLLSAVSELAKAPPRGIAVLFQPAEENGAGMVLCLKDERLSALDIEDAFSIHNVPGEPLGTVLLRPGCKASVGMQVTWKGESSHAASPWNGTSPFLAMAAWATTAQTWPEKDPLVSLVHVRLGEEAYGTCPGEAVGAATIRATTDEAVAETWKKMTPVSTIDSPLEVWVAEKDPFPATINSPESLSVISLTLGTSDIPCAHHVDPFPWSEDFGYALRQYKGALVGLGSGLQQPGLHDSRYEFPDELLSVGIAVWIAIASMESNIGEML